MKGSRPLRIGLIGPARFPVAEPFIGGLEAHIWALSRALTARGHLVTMFAAAGSDLSIAHQIVPFLPVDSTDSQRRDLSEASDLLAQEDLAYDTVMERIVARRGPRFDIIHNHSMHPGPIAVADRLGIPMVSTFHTPPLAPIVRALRQVQGANLCLAAVSRHAADMWSADAGDVLVVHNGVDIDDWAFGPGGQRLVWSGRLVPEKGADLAIEAAAMAGHALDLAGPIIDQEYFRSKIEPRLGADVRYLGHLTQAQLARTVGHAAVALVTPRWDEPFGLVVAEALACGTPVAAFARGGIPEIVNHRCARLAPPDDVRALAAAIGEALTLNRHDVRHHAERHCSLTRMVSRYEQIYRSRLAGLDGISSRGLLPRLSHGHLGTAHPEPVASSSHIGHPIAST